MPRHHFVVVASTMLLFVLTACTGQATPPTNTSADMPVYETFEAAARAADIVITAAVTDETQTIVDNGGDEANPGIELVATTVEVDEYLTGSGPDSLLVVQETKVNAGDNTVLNEGDAVVLALIEQGETSAPSVFDQLGVTYTPVSRDFGIAELRDGEVVPLTGQQPTTTLSDLRSGLSEE